MSDSESLDDRLDRFATQVALFLRATNKKCVFAESCTGGKMAAAMTAIPGISENFCGSAVTYRENTKTEWLSITKEDLAQHTAESEITTIQMAKRILTRTPEADYSVAITGHLGPNVDAEIDGIVYVSVADRAFYELHQPKATQHRLESSSRADRQTESASIALEQFLKSIH
jgi:nicotinamide-nucleotide amidase